MASQAKVLTSIDEVTPAWLTAVLHQAHALTNGQVVHVKMDGGSGNWSQNGRLTLTYSPDAQGDCPTNLFLKLVNTDAGDGEYFLPAEVTYYTRDYVDLPDVPLVRCYHAAHDPTQHRYHLLLDDHSATHGPAYDLPPTLAHGQALVEALAILHAHWWGTDRLRQSNAPLHEAAHLRRFVEIGVGGIPHVNTVFGEQLKPHWPELIAQIFAQLPAKLAERAQDPTHFTKLHGDPNPGNLLVPKVGERPLYLIDQQPFDWSITTWAGAYDLAYVMALHWPIAARRELERPLLQHYRQTLTQRGVTGYSWAQLYEDYRLCVALMVPVAVEYMRDGGDPDWNWLRLSFVRRSLTACDELHITELFS